MSQFTTLRNNPITFTVKPDAKEVIFSCVSVMCDNPKQIRFKKINGEFSMYTGIDAFSNFQFGRLRGGTAHTKQDFTWEADDQNWNEVARLIRTGTIEIKSVKSR